MEKIGLVLQGGGTRGVYTSGVLDFFLHKNLVIPYVIGVSAGACNGVAYVAKQPGLGKTMYFKYMQDKKSICYRNLLKGGNLFAMDYIFEEVPKQWAPLQMNQVCHSHQAFWIVTTNCASGKAEYFEKSTCKDIYKAIRASCSMPFISCPVDYDGLMLLDGGIVEPVPIEKSILDGNSKNIVILTHQHKVSKRAFWMGWLASKRYPEYTPLCQALTRYHERCNHAAEMISNQVSEKKAFVIQPTQAVQMGSIQRNIDKLHTLYTMGYQDAQNAYPDLQNWMNG